MGNGERRRRRRRRKGKPLNRVARCNSFEWRNGRRGMDCDRLAPLCLELALARTPMQDAMMCLGAMIVAKFKLLDSASFSVGGGGGRHSFVTVALSGSAGGLQHGLVSHWRLDGGGANDDDVGALNGCYFDTNQPPPKSRPSAGVSCSFIFPITNMDTCRRSFVLLQTPISHSSHDCLGVLPPLPRVQRPRQNC